MKSDHIYYQTFITSSNENPVEITLQYTIRLRKATTFTISTTSPTQQPFEFGYPGLKWLEWWNGVCCERRTVKLQRDYIPIADSVFIFADLIEDCLHIMALTWYMSLHPVSLSYSFYQVLDFTRRPNFKHPVDANKYKEALLLLHSEI